MNQANVPLEEVSVRLSILCEYLLDNTKPIEEAYESLMEKLERKLMEYTEFEYWYRRFQNKQFDLGYDTSQDSKEVPESSGKKDASTMTIEIEASVKVAERNVEDLKLDHQFDEENEPQDVQTHGENATPGISNAIQFGNDDRSETSNVSNSSDSKKTSENLNTIDPEASKPVEIVKRKMEDLKLNHLFKEDNVPRIIQTRINRLPKELNKISLLFNEQKCTINVGAVQVHFRKTKNDWIIRYPNTVTVHTTNDPEKSIIDHLWFVLKNPNINLGVFILKNNPERMRINYSCRSPKMDSGRMSTLLQAMFNTFDHQIQTSQLNCDRFDEDTFLSMLKHARPGTLEFIDFTISWKEEGNYQRMKEIVETQQWKQAERIFSREVAPLNVEDLLHCVHFELRVDRITPEDVLRVTKHFFDSTRGKFCYLYYKNERVDIDAIMNVLRSQNDGSKVTEIHSHPVNFQFKVFKSTKCIYVDGGENSIEIHN